jgi:RNA-directed DNA polymerase
VKSFEIGKRLIYEAWEKVRANNGAPGVDAVSIGLFEEQLKDNLYKLWNRMSSGSYFLVRCGAWRYRRIRGRVCACSGCLARLTGWRRLRRRCCWSRYWSRSFTATATDIVLGAVPMTRWPCAAAGAGHRIGVLDLDVRAFFDSVPHSLLLKAVAHHTSERWVLLYISRWLKAPMQMPDGTIMPREKGTPQGSPVSPLLANLFMHYALDTWMDREFPGCPFERYADDVVAHCDSEEQAWELRAAIAERLGALGLELHPVKTKIVYCKDANRRGNSEHTSFDFLGYTFRGRLALGRRGYFTGFSPAISAKAKKAKGKQIRDWHLNRRSGTDLSGLAREINPQVRGWINYYGAFYRSELRFLAWRINEHLARWAMHKFKRFRGKYAKAMAWLQKVYQHQPRLFAHWQLVAFT